MARTSITIDSDYLKKISVLGNKFGMNNKMFIQAMIDYFEFYQLNPREREVNLDSKFSAFDKKIDKLRDTFVSFIREMEKKKLEPIIKQSNESTQALLIFLKEQALTKDDLRTISLGGRRVAAIDNKVQNPILSSESNQEMTNIYIEKFKLEANSSLMLYKNYFTELVNAVSRRSDQGDYILVSAINDFKEKIKGIPKITFEGQKTDDDLEVIEKVETLLRTIDNYCDEFLNKGQFAAGKDKLFYSHTIREYQYKFENIKII